MGEKTECPKCGKKGTVRIKHIITDIEYYCVACGWFEYHEVT
jgi:predicted RNA-binding Zn-ribbon protein involved in translation (DUF1610 family)